MKKLLLATVLLVLSNSVVSQSVNQYKYASVPSKFTFLKEKDKYHLNTLTKLFMQRYGFETYLDTDTAPYDFSNTNCNKVYVDVQKNSNMFVTRLKVLLKDCNGKVLFTSQEGTSKAKELKVAYNEALRDAFASFSTLHYKYAEIKDTVKPIEVAVADPQPAAKSGNENTASTGTLYAQPIQNGFQLVNSEPKVVMKIYKTSNSDIYAAVRGNVSGVFIPKGNEWFFEYYQNDKLVSEKVDVKF